LMQAGRIFFESVWPSFFHLLIDYKVVFRI
jgi:hypothetical protein